MSSVIDYEKRPRCNGMGFVGFIMTKNLEERMMIDNICEIIKEWYGNTISEDEIKDMACDILHRNDQEPDYEKIRDIIDKYIHGTENGEADGLIFDILQFLEDETTKHINVRDMVQSDFKYQLETTNFDDAVDEDNSYQYMITQLDIHYRGKDPLDNSLTLRDCAKILSILDNEEYTLKEAYEEVVKILENEGEEILDSKEKRGT